MEGSPVHMREGYGARMGEFPDSSDLAPSRLTIAKAWVAARRARDRIFENSLVANPAWDILLDLYIHHAEEKQACVTQVCLASCAPETTVLRWIGVLETQGTIERSLDLHDRRRKLLRLTAQGLKKMEEALDASAESDARLGLGRLRVVSTRI